MFVEKTTWETAFCQNYIVLYAGANLHDCYCQVLLVYVYDGIIGTLHYILDNWCLNILIYSLF